MNPIMLYALEYQYRELKAGRNPLHIKLTIDQIQSVQRWFDKHMPLISDMYLDGKRMIYGMEIIEVGQ